MKLIHTADLHLDTCFAGDAMPEGFGKAQRACIREAFSAMLRRAVEWPADAVLIAGDLFELSRVSRDTIAYLQGAFEELERIPVFIAPGNRDPYVPNSPYATASWPENVTVFDTPQWKACSVEGQGFVVHGFGFDGPEPSNNPFGTLRIEGEPGVIHVAVAHGSERGLLPAGKVACAPFDASSVAIKGLSYLALGHYHDTVAVPCNGDTVAHYAGAPEPLGFDELGERHYLEVDIDVLGARARPVVSSGMEYSIHTLDCSSFDTVDQIVRALQALPGELGQRCVARVTLTGLCEPDFPLNVSAIQAAASSAFGALDLVNDVEFAVDYEELARDNSCLGIFIRKLNQEMADAPDDARRRFVKRARALGLAAYRQRRPAAICEFDKD